MRILKMCKWQINAISEKVDTEHAKDYNNVKDIIQNINTYIGRKREPEEMKNKRLSILLVLVIAAIAIFFCDRYAYSIFPQKLNAEKIEEIKILYDKPVIVEEPKPYKQMYEYVEYIESRKVDFYGESLKNIPVYRYEDIINVGDCSIFVGRDNGYYKFLSGRIVNPAFGIFTIFPTDAIREALAGENVYAVYDTDIGMRMYLFFSKEKNNYVRRDGFPIIMSKALEYKDFADIKIGDSSSKVEGIDPITLLHTQLWDEVKDDMISVRTEKGRGPTSIHLLKDGILKIEYKRIEPGEYEIIDIEYSEDFTLTGFDGDTCYKISELDYPPKVKGMASLILSRENNADEIAEIAKLFNNSTKHQDQGIGTTHPICVKIKYANDKEITFWCGVGDFITVASGKSQYNYVNKVLDEYIAEIISGELPDEPVTLTVVQDDKSIQPYRSFLFSTTYTEQGRLCADGMGAYFVLSEKAKVLPDITFDSSITFVVSGKAKVTGVSVFNSDLERTHHRIDEAEFYELCEKLDAGTYYISVIVLYEGGYILADNRYDTFAEEYIFKMEVEDEFQKEEISEELFVTVAPPQFDSEEEFLEEIKLIKNDKEEEKNTVEGKFLAEMESYYMPAAAPDGYELHKITITSEVFHLLYIKNGQEYGVGSVYELGYFYRNSDLTLGKVIENSHLVKSKYNDKLYFYFNESYGEYRLVQYELDGMVFYMRLPYGANLDDAEQINDIENLCRMVKKNIAG